MMPGLPSPTLPPTTAAAAPQQPAAAPPSSPPSDKPPSIDEKKNVERFKQRIETAKTHRRQFHGEWKRNIETRLGRVALQAATSTGVGTQEEFQTSINPDWALTKTKIANLFSQVPQVMLTHENKAYAPAIPPFAKSLNYELGEKRANVGVAMEEVLNDVVNAAGIGGVIVTFAARFETVPMPTTPPQFGSMLGLSAPTTSSVSRMTDYKLDVSRFSPSDALWPAEFTGSDFDRADWVGRTGRCSWAVAKNEFKLSDDVKEQVCGNVEMEKTQDDLRSQPERSGMISLEAVTFDEIYYWRHRVDPECKSFKEIWRLVFVRGMPHDQPAIHGPWRGQKQNMAGKYVGSCKFPIRFLTLTYVTDNPVPPSDSAAGYPQVMDMQRSRSQMFQNRERSIPVRWFNSDRVDPMLHDNLSRGVVQGMIPIQGDGSRAFGEIARASYPSEDFTFDMMSKTDLMETWQIGQNQAGSMSSGDKPTKAEVQTVQANFTTRIGQERGRVATFLLSIAEVMAGLMALYSDFPVLTTEERTRMQQAWDMKNILHDLVLRIRPDSTILLDAAQRRAQIMEFLNMTVKSGFVAPAPLIAEYAELCGLDPAEVMQQPNVPGPPPPSIALSFKGKEDLANPLVLAFMVKSGEAPGPPEIEMAKKLLEQSLMGEQPPLMPGPPQNGQGPAQGGPPPGALPDAMPNHEMASKVADRSRDAGGQ